MDNERSKTVIGIVLVVFLFFRPEVTGVYLAIGFTLWAVSFVGFKLASWNEKWVILPMGLIPVISKHLILSWAVVVASAAYSKNEVVEKAVSKIAGPFSRIYFSTIRI